MRLFQLNFLLNEIPIASKFPVKRYFYRTAFFIAPCSIPTTFPIKNDTYSYFKYHNSLLYDIPISTYVD